MSRYAAHVAAVLATAPRPTAEALDVISANLAKRNDPSAKPASIRTRAVHDTPTNGSIYAY